MSTTEPDSTVLARCSFCAKSNEQVKKMVAGPGEVFICDERITLCNEVIAAETTPEESMRHKERFANPSAEDLLARLRGLARRTSAMEADLQRLVLHAVRELNLDWERVGAELDLPADVVRQRFDHAE